MLGDESPGQYDVSNSREEQYQTVYRHWQRLKMVFSQPGGSKRYQREPEQQVQIRPHDPAFDMMSSMKEMMMVHIFFLIGFRNRLSVFFSWAQTYVRLRDGVRLIVGSRDLPGWDVLSKDDRA